MALKPGTKIKYKFDKPGIFKTRINKETEVYVDCIGLKGTIIKQNQDKKTYYVLFEDSSNRNVYAEEIVRITPERKRVISWL